VSPRGVETSAKKLGEDRSVSIHFVDRTFCNAAGDLQGVALYRTHCAKSGGAAVISSQPSVRVTAWDGHLSGTDVELIPGERIVQSWRTTKFSEADPDSTVTVHMQTIAEDTQLTLIHADVPDGHVGYKQGGLEHYYFEPMRRYFSRLTHLRFASGEAKSH
jgi:activator of HSP90 ATPase